MTIEVRRPLLEDDGRLCRPVLYHISLRGSVSAEKPAGAQRHHQSCAEQEFATGRSFIISVRSMICHCTLPNLTTPQACRPNAAVLLRRQHAPGESSPAKPTEANYFRQPLNGAL